MWVKIIKESCVNAMVLRLGCEGRSGLNSGEGKGEHTRWWKNSKQNYRSRREHGPSGQRGYDFSVQEWKRNLRIKKEKDLW